jgi:hypothetical protein
MLRVRQMPVYHQNQVLPFYAITDLNQPCLYSIPKLIDIQILRGKPCLHSRSLYDKGIPFKDERGPPNYKQKRFFSSLALSIVSNLIFLPFLELLPYCRSTVINTLLLKGQLFYCLKMQINRNNSSTSNAQMWTDQLE